MSGRGERRALRPFYGPPRTRPYVSRKRGPGWKVRLRELTPVRAKIADALAMMSALALAIGACLYLHHTGEQNGWLWISAILGALIAVPLLQWLWGVILRRNMAMSLDRVRLKRHWLFTWGVHETPAVGGFALAPHRKAAIEALEHEDERMRAAMRNQVVRPKQYYQDCGVLNLLYHGEYRKLRPIYPIHKAQRAEQRMQAVYEKVLQQGAARNFDPYGGDSDWTKTSGEFD